MAKDHDADREDDAPEIGQRLPGDLTEGADRPEPEPVDALWLKPPEVRAKRIRKALAFSAKQSERGLKRAALGPYPTKNRFEGRPDLARAAKAKQMATSPRCTAAKRDGSRCTLPVVRGSDRCQIHEGLERALDCPAAIRAIKAGRTIGKPRHRFKTHPSARAKAAKRGQR